MKNRNWFLLSVLLLMAAALLLRQSEQRQLRDRIHGLSAPGAPAHGGAMVPPIAHAPAPAPVPEPSTANVTSLGDDRQFPFRVRNTRTPAAELFRSETAVLLRNALVETREPMSLNIPAHLRAQGDPGSWVVQARGIIDDQFRAVLRGVGAEIVSYVPNNAFLVRASANDAQQLRASRRVQSVLPFEPFYKLDQQLLPLAVRREAMPAGRWLNVVLFNGAEANGLAALRSLGADVKGEQRFPFGRVVTIAPPADSLVALAQMPAVQNIEAYQRPVLLNDLSRVRLDVSTNTTDLIGTAGANWLNLRGNNVTVGIVGSGVDTGHAQLAGRTFVNAASPASDVNGHETFMAGVIAALDSTAPAATNGSIAGSTYRGIAPGALVYPLSLYTGGFTNFGHEFLITNAAAVPGVAIVNNSWGYLNPAYDIYAAIYDIAARDSDPARTNDQPLTYVFAAGNIGGGNSGGLGGAADTIVSPATAKNVITVGATEQFRLLVNTNDPLSIARTDSDSQVLDTSSRGNVGVGLESTSGRFKPDLVAPGSYDVSLRSATFTTPTDADNQLGSSSSFRYESGTSVAAAKVSGLLALMQEFFAVNYTRTNKPSFNKALLINRARSASPAYDL
ncbi:MAG: S8 family serine peptidase, partial [Limisphaerales bacterium]